MKIRRSLSLATGILAAAALTALPASADTALTPAPAPTPTPAATTPAPVPTVPSVAVKNECDKLTMTFTNPTRWEHVFDYKVGFERPSHGSIATGTIKEGPLAGQAFGPRYTLVPVAAAGTKTVVKRFRENIGDQKVSYRLAQGPEQKWFLPWTTVTVKTKCAGVEWTAPKPVVPVQPRCSDKNAYLTVPEGPFKYTLKTAYGRGKTLKTGQNKVNSGKWFVTATLTDSYYKVRPSAKTAWAGTLDKAPSAYTCS